MAKNVVAAGLADECEIQVAYAIGKANPFSVYVGRVRIPPRSIRSCWSELVKSYFDFRPAAFLRKLDLRRPIYAKTSALGHFGRPGFPWESTADADELKKAASRP